MSRALVRCCSTPRLQISQTDPPILPVVLGIIEGFAGCGQALYCKEHPGAAKSNNPKYFLGNQPLTDFLQWL